MKKELRLEWKGKKVQKRSEYPDKPITDDLKFYKGVLGFIRGWVRQECKPLKNEKPDRMEFVILTMKYHELHAFMCERYGLKTTLRMLNKKDSSKSFYFLPEDRITLTGNSLISYLHEFAHARGMSEYSAVLWSLSLFKRCMPKTYAKLGTMQHLKLRGEKGEL